MVPVTSDVRTFAATAVTAQSVVEAKRGRTISMCLPCHNEAATIGPIVAAARRVLVDEHPVLDELVVLDDRSTDATATAAASAGATVVPIATIHDRYGTSIGKGNALWASLSATTGDIVVWCDGDVVSFTPDWVLHLVTPLLDHDGVMLVKATYHRPTRAGGGGRTTELVARPLLSMFAPELAGLAQPLAGEFAGRRTALESIPFVCGWGVEIAMLLDVAEHYGVESIGQVDVGERHHRHQPLAALSVQAAEVTATVLRRVGKPAFVEELRRADGSIVPLNLSERPPLRDIRAATPLTD